MSRGRHGNMYLTSLPLVSGNAYLTSLPLINGYMYLTSLPFVAMTMYSVKVGTKFDLGFKLRSPCATQIAANSVN